MADHQDRHFKPARKTKTLLLVSALGIAVSLTYLALSPEKPFLSFSSLPEGGVVETTLSLNNETRTLTVGADETIRLESGPLEGQNYILTTIVRSDNLYRDILLHYDAQTDEAIIVADGFSSADTIRIVSGNKTSNSDVRFDWSGKIELSAIQEKQRLLCIETSAGISFCHRLPERAGA